MGNVNPTVLIKHKLYDQFFDEPHERKIADITMSLKNETVNPVIITGDFIIVSGQQVVNVAIKAGIENVPVAVKNFDSEDSMLRYMLKCGISKGTYDCMNPIKYARCIAELERIDGVRQGSYGKTTKFEIGRGVPTRRQTDLAKELGVEARMLRRYKSLLKLEPEAQQAVASGKIGTTIAWDFLVKQSPERQRKVAEIALKKEKALTKQQTIAICLK